MATVVFEDGQFVREHKLLVSANNRGLRYGDGVFETMKVNSGVLQLGNWHMERLFNALTMLQFEPPAYFTANYLQEKILQLAQRNGHGKLGRIRLMIYRGDGGLYETINHFPHHIIQSWSLPPANHLWNENGLNIGLHALSRKAMDPLANAKTNNYLPYVMGALDAKKNKWNDAVLLNSAERVCDCTIANLFAVKDNIIYTPPASEGPVLGVMRRYLLSKAADYGFTMIERPLHVAELLDADELFITNTSYGLRWVKEFGEKQFGNTLTQQIYSSIIQPLLNG